MSTLRSTLDLILNPIQLMADRVTSFLPRAAAALLLLLIGLVLSRALLTVIEDISAKLRLDEHTSRVGINELLTRLGLGKSPSTVVGTLAFWGVLLAFVVQAGQALELPFVSGQLDRLLGFLGSLVVAIAISFGGLAFARFSARIVERAAEANGLRGGGPLARAVAAIVLIFFGFLALEELGVQFSLTLETLKIALASLGLAFALAFGLGGKDAAAELLRDLRKVDKT